MADLFRSSAYNHRFQTAVWTFKLAFLSIGIISTLLLLKSAIPYSFNLFLSSLPRLWISFRSWLSPPYLYIVVNFIIITIAASSSFQQKSTAKKNNEEVTTEAENRSQGKQSNSDATEGSTFRHQNALSELWPEIDEISREPETTTEKTIAVIENSVETSPETSSDISCLTNSDEKQKSNPSVSARHRKSVRSTVTSEKPMKSLGVAKPKKHNDTLDATWKAITEGKGKPLTRHLKKSDTWDVPPRVIVADSEPIRLGTGTAQRELRKSETFNDAASSASELSGSSTLSRSGGGGVIRRELSMGQDELNRRVEAFIKNFNNEIRLQRQESVKRYKEMVNRGVY